MEATMHRTTMTVWIAEILNSWSLLELSHVHGMFDELVDTLVLHRTDSDNRYAQNLFHKVDADSTSIAFYLVHHVQRQHHWDTKFHKLHRQIEVSLDIGSIHYVDDGMRTVVYDKISTYDFFARKWRQAVNTR